MTAHVQTIRVVLLSLLPSCLTREKTVREKWTNSLARIPGGEKKARLASRISRVHGYLSRHARWTKRERDYSLSSTCVTHHSYCKNMLTALTDIFPLSRSLLTSFQAHCFQFDSPGTPGAPGFPGSPFFPVKPVLPIGPGKP